MFKILGAKIDNVDMVEALLRLQPFIGKGEARQTVTLNAEMLYRAQKNGELLRIINGADLVTADGVGIVWAARVLGAPLKGRVTGIDLMKELCRQAAGNNWKVFLLGGEPGVAEQAAQKLKRELAGLGVAGTYHGFFSGEEWGEERVLAQIGAARPQILFVGMGSPMQEYWISENKARLACDIVLGVGGSFDVISGRVMRAPVLWQKLRLEWLWRAVVQPRRIPRLFILPLFVWKVLLHKWRKEAELRKKNGGRLF
ncbi:MAG: WecB/TagA/CpsF family glycosyltransferase [Clostridiales bacterium]|nr:WecB/TagA/CpsF family glycosyltransferase [Clostridiales bacterium]